MHQAYLKNQIYGSKFVCIISNKITIIVAKLA